MDKPRGKTSFSLVAALRRILGVKKIGHAGTLDPFATGVMVMLIGRDYTKLSDQLLSADKEYTACMHLGKATDTYDCDGEVISESPHIPTAQEIMQALPSFQGEIEQVPPMFSAKKINGQKLYDLARQGKTVERAPVKVKVDMQVLEYNYPLLHIHVTCTKGTYIRSLAHDLGVKLGCGAHLTTLRRTRSGQFSIDNCVDGSSLGDKAALQQALRTFNKDNKDHKDNKDNKDNKDKIY